MKKLLFYSIFLTGLTFNAFAQVVPNPTLYSPNVVPGIGQVNGPVTFSVNFTNSQPFPLSVNSALQVVFTTNKFTPDLVAGVPVVDGAGAVYFDWTATLIGSQWIVIGTLNRAVPGPSGFPLHNAGGAINLHGIINAASTQADVGIGQTSGDGFNAQLSISNPTLYDSDPTSTSNSQAQYGYTSDGGSLPITFTGFAGTVNSCTANLKWSTTTEQNSKRFDVLQSTDGINWSIAAIVNAAGNSSSNKDYTSSVALIGNTINYFKIRETDIDGRSMNTNIIRLSCNGTVADKTIAVYPNPATNYITVELPATYKNALIIILDNAGRKVMVKQSTGSTVMLDVTNLAHGNYFITVDNGSEKKSTKFLKL